MVAWPSQSLSLTFSVVWRAVFFVRWTALSITPFLFLLAGVVVGLRLLASLDTGSSATSTADSTGKSRRSNVERSEEFTLRQQQVCVSRIGVVGFGTPGTLA